MFFKITKRKKNSGVTLVEILVATAIFAIAYYGLLLGVITSSYNAKNALIEYTAAQYADSLLDAVQSYNYEDSKYDTQANAFDQHTFNSTFPDFSLNDSGVCNDASNNNTIIRHLPEDAIGIKYYPTTIISDISHRNSLNFFTQTSTSIFPTSLIGMEINDFFSPSDPNQGKFLIKDNLLKRNIFQGDRRIPSNQGQKGDYQAKYYFCDDVDDFDGYYEEREILKNIVVKFFISVKPVFKNSSTTPNQQPFSYMNETVLDTASQQGTPSEKFTYYKNAAYKQISVLATWEYPIGSNRQHRIIFSSGKVNPNQDVKPA